MNWRSEFAEFDDVTYLNMAAQGAMPQVAARAAQAAISWKRLPHTVPSDTYFGLPDRVRAHLAALIHGEPDEIAVTTGASGGLMAVANAIDWQPGDTVLVARGEFPAHASTWMPLVRRRRIVLKTVEPQGRFLAAEDFFPHLESGRGSVRLVSTSLVRFDDAVRIDARSLSAACQQTGAYLLLDVSQCAGAMPVDVRELGADFLVCAGYKWLLSPYGTGFFWVRRDLVDSLPAGPLYWQALEGAVNFHSLSLSEIKPARGARRWDTPETSSFFNLAAMEASLEFIRRVGIEEVWNHNASLLHQMIERLPRDRCVLSSPADTAARGPFACFAARKPDDTKKLYDRLCENRIDVSLRENAIRVAPYLFNTPRDIDRLISVISV